MHMLYSILFIYCFQASHATKGIDNSRVSFYMKDNEEKSYTISTVVRVKLISRRLHLG